MANVVWLRLEYMFVSSVSRGGTRLGLEGRVGWGLGAMACARLLVWPCRHVLVADCRGLVPMTVVPVSWRGAGA